MNQELLKKATFAIILFLSFPIILMYFSILETITLWLYAWIIPFCYIVFVSNMELFTQGLLIIVITVIFCAIGSEIIIKNNPAFKEAIVNLSLLLTLMAGGLGGNFMAHDLIKMKDKNIKK